MGSLFIRSKGSGVTVLHNLLVNDYKFLHLDYTLPTPSWSSCNSDVSILAQDIRNYSRFLAARGQRRSDKATSRQLLSILVSDQTYTAAASSYLGQLDMAPPDLPDHLQLMELAETFGRISISDATAPFSASPYQPSARRLHAPAPSVFDDDYDPFGNTTTPTFQVNLTTGRGGHRGNRQRATPPNYQTVSSKKAMDSGELCAACKRPGHDSTRCFILAQILWALRYKDQYPKECERHAAQWVKDQTERAEKRKQRLSSTNISQPRATKTFSPIGTTIVTPSVAKAFCHSHGVTIEEAYNKMDWDFLWTVMIHVKSYLMRVISVMMIESYGIRLRMYPRHHLLSHLHIPFLLPNHLWTSHLAYLSNLYERKFLTA